MTDKETFEGEDLDGNTVKFTIKMPGAEEINQSQVEYNKAFKDALDQGALLRQKLSAYMRDQDLWSDSKQASYEKILEEISGMEEALQKGGIRLSEAKKIAMSLKQKREEFRDLIAEKNSLDAASAEGQADNARFSELVRLCTINPETNQRWFQEKSDYLAAASQPWVVHAAEKLGNAMYGLDPNYENNLEENKFLKEFKFVDKDLRFINEDGHLTDSEGRLLSEDGRFIAYENDEDYKKGENPYFVNMNGEKVVEKGDEWVKADIAERKPFLDDKDNPIAAEEKAAQDKPVKKRRTRTTKKDANKA